MFWMDWGIIPTQNQLQYFDGVMGDENIPFRLKGPGSGPNKKPLSQGSKTVLIKIVTMYIHT